MQFMKVVLGVALLAAFHTQVQANDCKTTVYSGATNYLIACDDAGCASANPESSCQPTPVTIMVNGQSRSAKVCVCSAQGSAAGVCCQAYQLLDGNGNPTGRTAQGKCSFQDNDCPYGSFCSFGTYGDPDQDQGKCRGTPPGGG